MEHEVLYRPSYSLLKIRLGQEEAISAEAGAMVSMSSGIQMETTAKGGLFGALNRGHTSIVTLLRKHGARE